MLPNSYDPLRFNPEVAESLAGDHPRTVSHSWIRTGSFIFVSTGHYRRKGFFLAVEAVARLRAHASLRPTARGRRRRRPAPRAPRRTRLVPSRVARSSSHSPADVPDVEKYFAAADALLFPSYSEAFALVEVEADACGLPLFLTRHHGSEMILQDGVNGRFIDFDAGRIAAVLAEFLSGELEAFGRGADPRARFGDLRAAAGR